MLALFTFAFTYVNTAVRTKWYFYGYLIVSFDSVGVYKVITSCCGRLKLWVNFVVKLDHNVPVKKHYIGVITVTVPTQYRYRHGRVNQLAWHHVCIPLNSCVNGNILRYVSCSCVCKSVVVLMIGISFGNYAFKIPNCETCPANSYSRRLTLINKEFCLTQATDIWWHPMPASVTVCYVTPRETEESNCG